MLRFEKWGVGCGAKLIRNVRSRGMTMAIVCAVALIPYLMAYLAAFKYHRFLKKRLDAYRVVEEEETLTTAKKD